MKRILIITAFALTLLTFGQTRPVQAAATSDEKPFTILPDCDRTVYYVQDDSKNTTCSKDNAASCIGGAAMTPERYDELYQTQADRKAHPPVITTNKQCGFNDFVQLFINLSSYGLGLLAVVGVAVIIWGGFGFLLAMGSQEKIKEAKQTIWGGVLGTFIVLIAFVMVNWVVSMLTGNGPVLFAGTDKQTYFYGAKCPSFKDCDKNNLHYNPGDGCKDAKKNGNGVTKAQSLLSRIGCYTGSIDGCYGPETKQAMTDFQNRNTLLFTPDTSKGPGAISSTDEWQKLEDAAVGAGGLLGCAAEAPLTRSVTLSYGDGKLFVSNDSATIKQDGTVTWTNNNEYGTEAIGIQFEMPIKNGTTSMPQLSILKKQSKSLTFPKAGTYSYMISYQVGGPTDVVTVRAYVNVIGQLDSGPSEQPAMP